MHRYSPEIEEQMEAFYQSLSEKDRRRYAAIEACKLGRGGLSYTAHGKELRFYRQCVYHLVSRRHDTATRVSSRDSRSLEL
jgi:hypothetical protein